MFSSRIPGSRFAPKRASRRDWLVQAGSLSAAVALAGEAGAAPARANPPSPAARRADAFKISLGQWSLHNEFFSSRLDPLDFATVANSFGIDAVEYVSRFYQDKAKDKAYLSELKKRAAAEGVWSALMLVDREGDLGASSAKERTQTVENHKKWLDAAAYLGCHAIRVNARGGGSGNPEEQASRVAAGLRPLCELGRRTGVGVLVENQGGLSSNASWLAGVVKLVNHPSCGTLADFGNFEISKGVVYDRYQGARELMPFAKAVSAKSYDFDRRGNETTINFLQMLKIVTDHGYRGYVGIEYEGKRLDEYTGIEHTLRLLQRCRSQLEVRTRRR